VPFPKVLSQPHQCEPGSWVSQISGFNIFQAELHLDSKKFWKSGWGFLLILRTDSTNCGNFIMEPLDTGSSMIFDSSNGRPNPALCGSKESVSQFYSVGIPF
jgi:hypothetical protein